MLGVVIVLGLQVLVRYVPEPYWQQDPAFERNMVVDGLTPVGVLVAAGASWLLVGLLVLVGWARRDADGARDDGGVGWVSLGLAATGIVGCMSQMLQHSGSLYVGAGWLAAAGLGLCGRLIGQRRAWAGVMVAVVLALGWQMAMDAGSYVLVEHPHVIEHFRQDEARFLASRGWEPGSTEHQEYLRRLHMNDATGRLGLSNVFGSIVGAIALVGVGVSVASGRRGMTAASIVAGLGAAAAMGTMRLSHSRGAMAAFAAVCVWACLCMAIITLLKRWRGRSCSRTVAVMFAAVLLAAPVLIVVARGAIGPPETAEGERSLLFRSHYLLTGVRMLVQSPWVGVGPGTFQDVYIALKPAINPEQVTSTHNMLLDYGVMLGACGWAWGAVLLCWGVSAVSRAAAGAGGSRMSEPGRQPTSPADRRQLRGGVTHDMVNLVAGAAAVLLLVIRIWLEMPGIFWPSVMAFSLAGMVGFAVIVSVVGGGWATGAGVGSAGGSANGGAAAVGRDGPSAWVSIGLAAGAMMLLVHNQIEMTFYQPGGAGLAWFMLGLASTAAGRVSVGGAANRAGASRGNGAIVLDRLGVVATIALCGGVTIFAGVLLVPIAGQQAHLRAAAIERAMMGQASVAPRTGSAAGRNRLDASSIAAPNPRNLAAIAQLDAAATAWPRNPRPYREASRLLGEEMARSLGAMKGHGGLTVEAGGQPAGGLRAQATRLRDEAIARLDAAKAAGLDDLSLLAARMHLWAFYARQTGDLDAFRTAIDAARRRTDREPTSLPAHLALADLLWDAGRVDAARPVYERCLALDALLYLDPADQLSDARRAVVAARARSGD